MLTEAKFLELESKISKLKRTTSELENETELKEQSNLDERNQLEAILRKNEHLQRNGKQLKKYRQETANKYARCEEKCHYLQKKKVRSASYTKMKCKLENKIRKLKEQSILDERKRLALLSENERLFRLHDQGVQEIVALKRYQKQLKQELLETANKYKRCEEKCNYLRKKTLQKQRQNH